MKFSMIRSRMRQPADSDYSAGMYCFYKHLLMLYDNRLNKNNGRFVLIVENNWFSVTQSIIFCNTWKQQWGFFIVMYMYNYSILYAGIKSHALLNDVCGQTITLTKCTSRLANGFPQKHSFHTNMRDYIDMTILVRGTEGIVSTVEGAARNKYLLTHIYLRACWVHWSLILENRSFLHADIESHSIHLPARITQLTPLYLSVYQYYYHFCIVCIYPIRTGYL